ncbi:MAG: hypothetical protein U0Y10_17490 [Spirosomataceae bacterium]
MKNKVAITLTIIGLLILGCFVYLKWIRSEFVAWEYIPSSSVLMIESNSLQQPKEKLRPHQIQLHDLPLLDDASAMLNMAGEVVKDSVLSMRFLKDKTVLYSLHPEATDRLNFIVYLPINPSKDGAFVERLTNPKASSNIRSYSHTFEGMKVTELYEGNNKVPVLAYLIHDNYLIFSKSSLLVEDVVRQANGISTRSVEKLLAGVHQDDKGKFVKLYLQRSALDGLNGRMLNADIPNFAAVLSLLLANREFQFSVTPDKQIAFAIGVSNNQPFLKSFNNQSASKIQSGGMIPNNTAVLFRFGFSNPMAWSEDFKDAAKSDAKWTELRDELTGKYSLNLDSAYYYMKDEALFCKVETDNAEALGHVLILPTKYPTKFLDYLNFESGKIQLVERSSVLKETFMTYPIKEMKVPLPYLLFGSLFSGFEKTYYTVYGNYVLMADKPQILKNTLSDITINNVWSKAVKQNNILNHCRSSQFTMIVNPLRAWSSMNSVINGRWSEHLLGLEDRVKQFSYVIMQCVGKNKAWQTNLLVGKGDAVATDATMNKLFLQKKLPLKSALTTRPFLFKNATAKTNELLIQTVDNKLTFMNPTGEVFSSYQLDKPVISNFQPIDYFKNNRIQYTFGTADRLWFFDRADTTVQFYASEPFTGINLKDFSVFYEPTNKQKLIVSDLHGGYFAFSKTDRTLKALNYIFGINHTVVPVQSVNLGGIDYDILLQENGKLHISNSRGAEVKNSPFDLRTNFNSPVFIESSAQFSSYVFHAVSRQGTVITVNLKGEVVSNQQLLRPARDSDFKLLPEQNNNDWLITCTTGQTVGVLNKRGQQLFEFQHLQPDGYEIAYYNFGSDIKFLTLRTGKTTKIFDLTGRQIGDKGIDSDFPVSLSYSESYNKLFIYAASEKNIDIWTVKVK